VTTLALPRSVSWYQLTSLQSRHLLFSVSPKKTNSTTATNTGSRHTRVYTNHHGPWQVTARSSLLTSCHPVTTHQPPKPTLQYSFSRFKLPLLTSGPWSQGPLRCGGEAISNADWTCHLRPLLSLFYTRSCGRFLFNRVGDAVNDL
jgi:hypothetical protein